MGSHIAISSFSHKFYVITAEEFISKKSTVHENPLAPQTISKHLREGFDKDQPGCSAPQNFLGHFSKVFTTYHLYLGGGLWVGGSPGPPGAGG